MRYPLMLALKPSKAVMASVVVAHVAAALALFFALRTQDALYVGRIELPVPALVIACCVVLAFSAWRSLRTEWSKRALQLVLSEDGSFRCEALFGDRWARMEGGTTDFGWVVCLRLRLDDLIPVRQPHCRRLLRTVPLVVVPGNLLRPADWRGLRIWLRHKAFRAATG